MAIMRPAAVSPLLSPKDTRPRAPIRILAAIKPTSLVLRMRQRPLSSCTTFSASLNKRFRVPISWPTVTGKSTGFTCLTGLRAKLAPSTSTLLDTDDKKKRLGEFLAEFSPPKVAAKVPDYVQAVRETNSSISQFGVLGVSCTFERLKTIILILQTSSAGGPKSRLSASRRAQIHFPQQPLLTHQWLTLPMLRELLLHSRFWPPWEEAPKDIKEFENALGGPKHVEVFGDQIHGWMGARSNLSDARVKAEYERGYKTVLTFFGKHMINGV